MFWNVSKNGMFSRLVEFRVNPPSSSFIPNEQSLNKGIRERETERERGRIRERERERGTDGRTDGQYQRERAVRVRPSSWLSPDCSIWLLYHMSTVGMPCFNYLGLVREQGLKLAWRSDREEQMEEEIIDSTSFIESIHTAKHECTQHSNYIFLLH